MLCLSKRIKEGDFSFIDDPIERKSMDFDYRVYYRLKKLEINNVVGFMNYSEDTYVRNIRNLAFIDKHGWKSFLEKYPNIN